MNTDSQSKTKVTLAAAGLAILTGGFFVGTQQAGSSEPSDQPAKESATTTTTATSETTIPTIVVPHIGPSMEESNPVTRDPHETADALTTEDSASVGQEQKEPDHRPGGPK